MPLIKRFKLTPPCHAPILPTVFPLRPPRKNSRLHLGFSLAELLVVLVIIAVLAALIFPALGRIRAKANAAQCASNLRQLGGAMLSYYSERANEPLLLHDSSEIWTLALARKGYLGGWDGRSQSKPCGKGAWTCPSSNLVSDNYGGYGVVEGSAGMPFFNYWYSSAFRTLLGIQQPAKTWLLGDAKVSSDPKVGWYAIWLNPSSWTNNHGPAFGRHVADEVNVFMFDGHLESLNLQELQNGRYSYPEK